MTDEQTDSVRAAVDRLREADHHQPPPPDDPQPFCSRHECSEMKQLLLTAVAISLALTASESLAAKVTVHVQPNGKKFTIEPVDEGMLRFTITRDPAQTKKPSDPELRVVRSAHLTVSDGERDIVAVPVAPRTMRNRHLKYSFEVLEAYVPHTSFRISGTEERKDRTGYVGGGIIFFYQVENPAPLKDESKP